MAAETRGQVEGEELRDLGETIDALLVRLDGAFQAQRAFVANASHELRTPLTLSRAMLQFALADPELTLESLRAACADSLDADAELEQLLDALLSLAESQQQIEHRESFDLEPIVQGVIDARGDAATLSVRNTGPQVPPDQIQRLLAPFRRLATDRTGDGAGHGLGLSIVAAIAAAHDATLDLRANPAGGLHVQVRFAAREPSGSE